MSRRARKQAGRSVGAESRPIVLGPGLLAGLALLLVAGLGLAWFLLQRQGGQGPSGGGDSAQVTAGPTGPQHEVGTGVTVDGDPVIGRADAPVTIVAYSDYQCPNCGQFATEVLPWLKQSWLGQGFVRVVFRDFPIRGADSLRAAEAAHCAGDQGRYWSYHDQLFQSFGGGTPAPFAEANLAAIAEALGLDGAAFQSCLASGRHRARVEAAHQGALAQGFEGTPTFVINGRRTQGAIGIADWDQLFRLYQQDLSGTGAGAGTGASP